MKLVKTYELTFEWLISRLYLLVLVENFNLVTLVQPTVELRFLGERLQLYVGKVWCL